MPRRTDVDLSFAEWQQHRKMILILYRTSPASERSKIAESLERPVVDAWGNEVLMDFDNKTRTATFVSTGPDAKQATPDDVICQVVGGKNWDDSYDKVLWDYVKRWTLPEGLSSAIEKAVEEPEDRKAEFSKVVQ